MVRMFCLDQHPCLAAGTVQELNLSEPPGREHARNGTRPETSQQTPSTLIATFAIQGLVIAHGGVIGAQHVRMSSTVQPVSN